MSQPGHRSFSHTDPRPIIKATDVHTHEYVVHKYAYAFTLCLARLAFSANDEQLSFSSLMHLPYICTHTSCMKKTPSRFQVAIAMAAHAPLSSYWIVLKVLTWENKGKTQKYHNIWPHTQSFSHQTLRNKHLDQVKVRHVLNFCRENQFLQTAFDFFFPQWTAYSP